MKKQRVTKGLLQDLSVPILVLIFIGVLLFIQQQGYQGIGASGIRESFMDQDLWEAHSEEYAEKHWSSGRKALLVWAPDDEESRQVYEQVHYVLSSVGVEVTSLNLTLPEDSFQAIPMRLSQRIPDGCTDVILCFTALRSSGIEPADLEQWVRDGGCLMLAGGLEAEELDSSWTHLLGITKIDASSALAVDSMVMLTNFLAGARGMEFSEEVIECEAVNAMLSEDCTIHIVTADEWQHPLLWERNYGNSHILVCNADLMDNKSGRGVIISAFSCMNSAFVYPVINAAVYCIDDFPSVAPAGYDRNVLSQYGYTIGDFYANVWWPAMQSIAEKHSIPYSAFLIESYEANVDGPFSNVDNYPSAAYFAKQLLELGGEMGLHGYNHQPLVLEGFEFDEKNDGYTCWTSVEDMISSIKAALAYGGSLSKDVVIQSYVAPSNVLGREAMSAMIRQFEDLRIFAGVYIGTSDQLVQEFDVLEEDVVLIPRLTADMQMDDSEWWLQINELNYHYYEANYIHPDDVLDEERSDGGDFKAMLNGYEQMVQWNNAQGLTASTISEAAGSVQRYCLLSVEQECTETGLDIHVNGLVDSGYLMLRSRKVPLSISSGQLSKIDEGCYIIRVDYPDIHIEWENK